jgi:hypothetical protein
MLVYNTQNHWVSETLCFLVYIKPDDEQSQKSSDPELLSFVLSFFLPPLPSLSYFSLPLFSLFLCLIFAPAPLPTSSSSDLF